MEIFPFTQADWQPVQDASAALVNATLAEDAVLQASQFAELEAVLKELRERYGDHPILLETEANFLDDPSLQGNRCQFTGKSVSIHVPLSMARKMI
jgi:hypothetical protein